MILNWFSRTTNTASLRSGRTLLLLCQILCLMALAGCSGDERGEAQEGASPVSAMVHGRIYPAASGVVMVEYGHGGAELQRSTPSATDGSFQFLRRLSGKRLEALYAASTDRVPQVHSSQLGPKPVEISQLEITPLTTWYDQLVANGTSRTSAARNIQHLITMNCPTMLKPLDSRYLYAYAVVPIEDHDWLLNAASAYLQMARNLGVGPKVDFAGWSDVLNRYGDMLSQLCAFSATISTAEWAQTQADLLKQEAQVQSHDAVQLSVAISDARIHGLAVMARQIQQIEYPDQTALLQAARNVAGRELTLGSDFVIARYLRAKPSGQTAPELITPPTSAGVAIRSSGDLVNTVQGSATAAGTAPASLRLVNQSDTDKQVRLVINGQNMASLPSIIEQIVAMPVAYSGEPLYRKAWRYVMAHKRNTQPLARSFFQYQPDLWLRSVGSGYCDAQASVLYRIWQAMGYQARVYSLTGHITVEILIDDRWQVFDPYLEVYYTDRQDQIVGVAELENDSSLITYPATPLLPLSDIAYSNVVADIFGTSHNNYAGDEGADYMSTIPQTMGSEVQIPDGGYLEVDARTNVTLDSLETGYEVDMSTMRLWVPPGYTGIIRLPLLLLDVKGAGSVQLLGRREDASGAIIENRGLAGLGSLDVATTDIHSLLQYFYFHDASNIGVTEVKVNSSSFEGLTLTLLVNPLYFKDSQQLTVLAYGADVDGLSFRTSNSSSIQ